MNKILSILVLLVVQTFVALEARAQLDHFMFGVDYYPEHWDESMWERDAQLMKEAGVNTVRIGEFAWYYYEPEEGVYQFDLFDRAIAVLAKYDIKVIMGTPTAAPPKWMTDKYPEIITSDITGKKFDDQTRRQVSLTSPVYNRFSQKIVEQMVLHFKDNPNVIGWQIDNEINCHIDEYYGENEEVAFRSFLRNEYKTLDSLNHSWGNKFWSQWYDEWDQIDLPYKSPAFHNPALILNYKRFISQSVYDYMKLQTDIIRKHLPQAFITSNGTFKNIDYYQLTELFDIYSDDVYPCFFDETQYSIGARHVQNRSFMDNFMIMEQQTGPGGQTYLLRTPRPGEMKMWAMQAVAHGANSMVHFRWRTALAGAEEFWYGVLSHDNRPSARYAEFKEEGQDLLQIADEIYGSGTQSDIAYIKDFESDWVFDHQFLSSSVEPSDVGVYRACAEQHYNLDMISTEADFNDYKIIIADRLVIMTPALADKIEAYVRQGGVFVMSAHSAVKNENNGMEMSALPLELTDVFGAEVQSFNCYNTSYSPTNTNLMQVDNRVVLDGAEIPVNAYVESLKLSSAKPIGRFKGDYLEDQVAIAENVLGSGKAVYYGSFFNYEAGKGILNHYDKEIGLSPVLAEVPEQLEVVSRSSEGAEYIFIINHELEPIEFELNEKLENVITGKGTKGKVKLDGFGYIVLKRNKS